MLSSSLRRAAATALSPVSRAARRAANATYACFASTSIVALLLHFELCNQLYKPHRKILQLASTLLALELGADDERRPSSGSLSITGPIARVLARLVSLHEHEHQQRQQRQQRRQMDRRDNDDNNDDVDNDNSAAEGADDDDGIESSDGDGFSGGNRNHPGVIIISDVRVDGLPEQQRYLPLLPLLLSSFFGGGRDYDNRDENVSAYTDACNIFAELSRNIVDPLFLLPRDEDDDKQKGKQENIYVGEIQEDEEKRCCICFEPTSPPDNAPVQVSLLTGRCAALHHRDASSTPTTTDDVGGAGGGGVRILLRPALCHRCPHCANVTHLGCTLRMLASQQGRRSCAICQQLIA